MANDELQFTEDWFVANQPDVWSKWLGRFKGRDHVRMLEIGSFEGRSARWLVQNILTGADCTLTCVDPFLAFSHERERWCDAAAGAISATGLPVSIETYQRFCTNLRPYIDRGVVIPVVGTSAMNLPRMCAEITDGKRVPFDFVYVDGDHGTAPVLFDTVLAFQSLRVGGILCWDDYPCPQVKPVVDSFLKMIGPRYVALHAGYQVMIRKTDELSS